MKGWCGAKFVPQGGYLVYFAADWTLPNVHAPAESGVARQLSTWIAVGDGNTILRVGFLFVTESKAANTPAQWLAFSQLIHSGERGQVHFWGNVHPGERVRVRMHLKERVFDIKNLTTNGDTKSHPLSRLVLATQAFVGVEPASPENKNTQLIPGLKNEGPGLLWGQVIFDSVSYNWEDDLGLYGKSVGVISLLPADRLSGVYTRDLGVDMKDFKKTLGKTLTLESEAFADLPHSGCVRCTSQASRHEGELDKYAPNKKFSGGSNKLHTKHSAWLVKASS